MRYIYLLFILLFLEAVKTASANPQDVIIMFGDSITSTRPHLSEEYPAAFSGNVNGLSIGPTVERLEGLLNSSGKDVVVMNYGWSGTTTSQGVKRLGGVIDEAKNKFPRANFHIAILYGTNDPTVGGLSVRQTEENITTMINIALNKGVDPVIGTLLPRLDMNIEPYNLAVLRAANNANVKISDHNSFWLDILGLLENDGIHPRLEGYKIMGDFWFESVFRDKVEKKKNIAETLTAIYLTLELL